MQIRNTNELLEGLLRGSEAAFETIYEQTFDAVFHSALALCKSREKAHDFTQEVYAKLWEKRKEFAHVDDLKSYLCTVATRMAYDEFRKLAKEELGNLEFHLLNHHQVKDFQPELEVDDSIDKKLHQLLDVLPPARREIFALRAKGKSSKEIASKLGLTLATVKTQLLLGKRFLRKNVEGIVTLFAICINYFI